MAIDTTNKIVTIAMTGVKITSAFNTVVTQVKSPDSNSVIAVDSLKGVELSLGDYSAKELGITKDTPVTIKPVEGSDSFTLEVTSKPVASKTSETKGSSPSECFRLQSDRW